MRFPHASTRKIVAIGAVLAITAAGVALAETTPGDHSMGPDHMREMMVRPAPDGTRPHAGDDAPASGHDAGGHAGMHGASTTPTLPGQDAFGAIQEIVRMLDADPKTDWSKVDLEALRQHLIDMNEVTLKAEAAPKQIDGGLEIAVTGSGRTLVAIQRMIPAWARSRTASTDGAQRRRAAERRTPDRHRDRPEGGPAHSRSRVHRPAGQRFVAPAAPSRDGEGRVRPRTPKPHALSNETQRFR